LVVDLEVYTLNYISLPFFKKSIAFLENEEIACKGGTIAGNARKDIEKQLGRSVVSPKNAKEILDESKKKKLDYQDRKKKS